MDKNAVGEYIAGIIRPLLSIPEDFKIEVKQDELGVLFTLGIPKPDFGKVIGKQGVTINAVRTLAKSVGFANGMRVNIKVPDQERERVNNEVDLRDI